MTNEQLVAAIQAGNRDKLSELWNQVERFIRRQAVHRAQFLNGSAVDIDDLIQAGFLGLLAAVESFDAAAGKSFISWLALYLQTAFNRAAGYLSDRQKHDPIHNYISLYAPLDGDDGNTLEDIQTDPDSLKAFEDVEESIWCQQLRTALDAALDQIPADQAEAIRRRYFQGNTLEQIGSALGVSAERARQVEEKGLRALREPEVCSTLEEYIERRTPYFLNVGVEQFHRSQTSAVERIVLIRERLREQSSKEYIGGHTTWTPKND